jgi:hypothetical protein
MVRGIEAAKEMHPAQSFCPAATLNAQTISHSK